MEGWFRKSNFNIQHFIEAVRDLPQLWDIRCKLYYNGTLKNEWWGKVARKVFNEFDNLENDKQELIIKELKKKWRHLKDSYKREFNIQKLGKRKKYGRYEALSFLSPVISAMTANSTSGDAEDEENEDREIGTSNDLEALKSYVQCLTSSSDEENEQCETEAPSTSVDFESAIPKKQKAKTSVADVHHQLKSLDERTPKKRKHKEKDEDFYFLNSLLSYTRAVQGNDKLAMRCEILQIVNKYYNKEKSKNLNPINPATHYLIVQK